MSIHHFKTLFARSDTQQAGAGPVFHLKAFLFALHFEHDLSARQQFEAVLFHLDGEFLPGADHLSTFHFKVRPAITGGNQMRRRLGPGQPGQTKEQQCGDTNHRVGVLALKMIPFKAGESSQMDKRYAKGKLQLEGNLASLRAQLDEIARNDAAAETKVKAGNKTGCWGLALIFVGIFTAAFGIGIPILLIGIVMAIFGFSGSGSASNYDLENMRYQLPSEILEKLAVDLDPERPISLMIDFRASQSPQFVQKTQQNKVLFFSVGDKVTYFSHPWLELSATSVDGHRIKISLTREGTYKSVPKRKRTKTRLRYYDVISTVVRPPAGQEWTAGSLDKPSRQSLRTFQGRTTQQGVAVKAAGPIYSVTSNRGTSTSGAHVHVLDVLGVLIACFRGLSITKESTSV